MDYHTFHEIKRLHQEEKFSTYKIGIELGLDYKTVKHWINRPKFEKRSGGRKAFILNEFKKEIQVCLDRYDYSAVQLYDRIKEAGYVGSISTVRSYVAKVRPVRKKAYLTLCFLPGETAQVDFAYCGYIQLETVRRRLYAFVMTLCYSRMTYLEFIMHQNQEHFLQCHRNAFTYFSGVPEKIMVDNCKVAVKEHPTYGPVKLNDRYKDFACYYGFKINPCGVRQPNQKGGVERTISYIRKNLLNGIGEVKSLSDINNAARIWMDKTANVRIHKTTGKMPIDMFKIETEKLLRVNQLPFDCATIKTVKSNNQFRVYFEGNRYSVPFEYASSILTMKIYPDLIMMYHENKLIAQHTRSYEKNIDFELHIHVKKLLEEKRNAKDQKLLRAFLKLSPNSEKYYLGLKEKRFNAVEHIRKIMTLAEIYGGDDIRRAIDDALEFKAYSSDYIANLLEQRKRFTPKAAPLHLMRKRDMLDIEFSQPNMDLYEKIERRHHYEK